MAADATTRCIDHADCSPEPTNASTTTAATSSSGCSRPATRRAEVRVAWHAKEVVRSISGHTDPDLAVEFVTRLGGDLQDESCPPEVRQLGRTITKWRSEISAWYRAHVPNGPTEAANNLIEDVEHSAFGFTGWRNYPIRSLLYAGRPNWNLLATINPTCP
ncbi:MAG: transposase [Acidimicrobiales bacterium]